MKRCKRWAALLLSVATLVSLCACGSNSASSSSSAAPSSASVELDRLTAIGNYSQDSDALIFDNSAWSYDADNDVYYQIGVPYCFTPQATEYETLGIYVPGTYMTATDNGDGTYTCTVNSKGTVGDYTASTAPIVLPLNTPGYAAQAAPTSYSYDGLSDYLAAGFIYVYAGMRGRDNGTNPDGSTYAGGAPWGITDLKSAVRYIRFNGAALPGNTDAIFTFGMSGGGAQSALMGATGDDPLYFHYLTTIGSAMIDMDGAYISDAVTGSMCWCPITSLDVADEAYEWMMGQYAADGTRADDTWTAALSDDLASAFADYINAAKFQDEDGNVLTLDASDDEIYATGSYYDYMLGVIQQSLNNFLSDTTFPYTPSNAFHASGNFGGGKTDANAQAAAEAIQTQAEEGAAGSDMTDMPASGVPADGEHPTDGKRGPGQNGNSSAESVTYDTVEDYIAALNSDEAWITYDAKTNTASITSIAAFVQHCKNASKDVGAFDDLNRSQAENAVFGNQTTDSLHFDATMSKLLTDNQKTYATFSDWDNSYVSAYADDLTNVDELGNGTEIRQNMYNPLYYIWSSYDGYNTSTVAKYWRINTGINQGDTSLSTEMNLALALQQNSGVESVDFTTVWGMQHTMAERTGDSTANFIAWVAQCCAA